MSGLKAALKAAKAAIDAQRYEEAVVQAEKVLASEPHNYHANVFLGLAQNKLNRPDESARAYRAAIKDRSADPLAWQGLMSLYERQGQPKLDDYQDAVLRLTEIYREGDDRLKCQAVVDRYQTHVESHGSRSQRIKALELLLPSSPIYDFLEPNLPIPSSTYVQLAQLTEAEEKETINREIGERRTRLGARIDQVNNDVREHVLGKSPLEDIYQNIIDWTKDDDERRAYEEKLLQHAYNTLLAFPLEKKATKRGKVEKMAKGMVIIKHPFKLAWDIVLEWNDGENLASWDLGVFRQYIEFFPEEGLAKVLKGYLSSPISPFPEYTHETIGTTQIVDSAEDKPSGGPQMASEDRLILMADGVASSPHSALSHFLVAEYYQHLEEYEGAMEINRKALSLLSTDAQKTGLAFENSRTSLQIALAMCLIYYQSPKHFAEARILFETVLKCKPTSTPALIGMARILREQEDYDAALDSLKLAMTRSPENITIRAEAAWCRALLGDYATGGEELEGCLPFMEGTDKTTRNMRAEALYRIGICLWNIDPSPSARKIRSSAYSRFLGALQANPNYAPAYTKLGIYYADYGRDKKRARKCFLKAFELSASETIAAERLARDFADEGDWDLVDLVAQRVVDSGKTRVVPGSKAEAISWPLTALGVVQLGRQDYAKSVVSFQSALRISPNDYYSWIGLGESYHSSGRYIAATRAFEQAQKISDEVHKLQPEECWFAQYMMANVKRELGDYEKAIQKYKDVLVVRPEEFGVLIALVQTLVDAAWQSIELGFCGCAAEYAREVIDVAAQIVDRHWDVFNLWKAIADACAIYSSIPRWREQSLWPKLRDLLEAKSDLTEYNVLVRIDGIGSEIFTKGNDDQAELFPSRHMLHGAILALKRALKLSTVDKHTESVAWYNLGWGEYHAYFRLQPPLGSVSPDPARGHLKASVYCFRRAIEAEAGNSEFWNALGVASSTLAPKISQHSFVRSLFLNDKKVQVWTNLGALCLLHKDYELANQTFARAQATDPDYAQAWLGQGVLAVLLGESKEAQLLFTHAFEIADSSLSLSRRQYALSTFDQLVLRNVTSNPTDLIQPVFALYQLQSHTPLDPFTLHLSGLYHERVGDYYTAIDSFRAVCESFEQDYEVSESLASLAHFAEGKADLARAHLAADDFEDAIDCAETALQLSAGDSSDEPSITDPAARQRCWFSAHLTAGLAHFHLGVFDKALDMLGSALKESRNSADTTCLLAQVLWAKGGKREHAAAAEQLLGLAEKEPMLLSPTLLLGAIALLDEDQELMQAISRNLEASRGRDGLSTQQRQNIDRLLSTIAAVLPAQDQEQGDEIAEARTSVYLFPFRPYGWHQLASLCDDAYPATMALKTAQLAVPPGGELTVERLAETFAFTGNVGDSQRSIMVAPWMVVGWEGLSAPCLPELTHLPH